MSAQILFQPAVKHEAKLRLAIIGAAGCGKTYTALMLASQLASHNGGKFAVVDTERGSASLYADRWGFDSLAMEPPYKADRLVQAIQAAEQAGYSVLVIDSLSHFWAGTGGILEEVDQAAKVKYGGNSRYAWADGTPKHNRIMDYVTGSSIHIICTMRAKPKYVEQLEGGKTKYVKVGTEPVQRSGVDHEFDLVLNMDQEHVAQIDKGRFPELDGEVFDPPTPALVDRLVELLHGEALPTPEELEEKAQTATEVEIWAVNAYKLPTVGIWFENAGRVVDWVKKLTGGQFNPEEAQLLLDILNAYCGAMADGATIKASFDMAQKKYQAESKEPAF